ncbi:glycerophosphodiester phosphodiesterase [Alkaliphilus peptidifermentans]|uniref:Glycerophosphoryl diester phosphodiesterase n=1 Tax=Alkaliphilus peptidifermentans DSM 18978 TaxID=1120976 RepID=A0A1G5JM18_9FIRM|nr:glycerophosphodiester phosphodiesterase [Alkaliphilus peptidifermentans]SCY89452.1 glycerophosphoryl diester phosphodiesterase [Alkaliphilus peptidifermentans DSM 18978]
MKTKIIAHRGASGYAPENTMASFLKALEMGADGIELDIHLSADEHLIVCHDEKVDRTTNGEGFIKDLSLKMLKELDAGSWFDEKYINQKIPTLEEVLELLIGKNILLNIEIKSGPIFYNGIEKRIVEVISKYGYINQTIFSSFNHFSLVDIKKINNKLKTAPLYMAGLVNPWKYAKEIGADGIHPMFYGINSDIVKGCLEHNLFINTFTVNAPHHLKSIIDLGVTGVITNYPDIGLDLKIKKSIGE